jgi:hypothetical protein
MQLQHIAALPMLVQARTQQISELLRGKLFQRGS